MVRLKWNPSLYVINLAVTPAASMEFFSKSCPKLNIKNRLKKGLFPSTRIFFKEWTFSPDLLALPSSLPVWVSCLWIILKYILTLQISSFLCLWSSCFYWSPSFDLCCSSQGISTHMHIYIYTNNNIRFNIWTHYRPSTRVLLFNKLTWPPLLVTWVSLPITFLPLNNWTLALLRSLKALKSPRSSLVK